MSFFELVQRTSLPIKTKLLPGASKKDKYKYKKKVIDPRKKLSNTINCLFAKNQSQFWKDLDIGGPGKYLTLDGIFLGTTNAMVTNDIPLECIDVVSRSVAFDPIESAKTGRLSSNSLDQFLESIVVTDRDKQCYDGCVMDFCGTIRTAKKSIELYFNKHLAEPVSVLSITLCYRNGTTPASYKYEEVDYARGKVIKIARKNGYIARAHHPNPLRNGTVFTLFFKIIRPCELLDKKNGICGATYDKCMEWLMDPVQIPEEMLLQLTAPLESQNCSPSQTPTPRKKTKRDRTHKKRGRPLTKKTSSQPVPQKKSQLPKRRFPKRKGTLTKTQLYQSILQDKLPDESSKVDPWWTGKPDKKRTKRTAGLTKDGERTKGTNGIKRTLPRRGNGLSTSQLYHSTLETKLPDKSCPYWNVDPS